MSDTPRTDEQINGKPCTRFEVLAGDSLRNASVPSDFARELEHELNIELERANYYRDKWQRNEQRIKRLEEAYSATEAVRTIRDCWCNHDPDTWTRCSTCCDKIKRYHAAKANLNQTEEAKEAKL